jgi:predicted AlkP superfamily pyrophosphatase or phosphodiesterase
VVLLSWDGTRWDYPDRVELPALERMAHDGVRAERLLPVFPTSTFPNHVSLATGTHPDRHGIVSNIFVDGERGLYRYDADASWIEAEPLWVSAERQGVRTATFFWVGSETDWHGVGSSLRRAPFDDAIGEAEKVEQTLAWLDLPEAQRPRLILSWWHGADGAGHAKGPDHPDVLQSLVEQDRQLARLLAGLDARDAWSRTTLLLVSDHGMAQVDGRIDAGAVLARHGIEARVTPGGGFAWVRLGDRSRRDEALRVLREVPGLQAWPSEALPEGLRAYHPRRSGDLMLSTTPPLAFYEPRSLQARLYVLVRGLFGGSFGLHGYLPSLPEMHAVFFAMGRGVPADLELGPVRAIDVAPTVAHLLGIEPPRDAEGQPIQGIAP